LPVAYFLIEKSELVSFGVLEINGEQYRHYVVIDKRSKSISRNLKHQFGYTPVSLRFTNTLIFTAR
jgi:hypothetical protein